MPVWSLIGAGLVTSSYLDEWESIFNTSYSWILGDNINFIVGGGRLVNIYGSDVRVVMDWEELIQQGMAKGLPDTFSTSSIVHGANHSTLTSTNSGLNYFMGIGGATDLVFGNKSVFNYYGESLVVKRLPHAEIVVTPPKPLTNYTAEEIAATKNLPIAKANPNIGLVDIAAMQAKITAANKVMIAKMIAAGVDPLSCVTVPLPIKLCLAIGSLGLLAAALILRFYNGMDGLYNSSQAYAKGASESTTLAFAIGTALISQTETTWLYILKMMEVETQVTPGLTEVQKDELDKAIAAATDDVATLKNKIKELCETIDSCLENGNMIWAEVGMDTAAAMSKELAQTEARLVQVTENKTNAIANALVSSYASMGY